MQIIILFLHVLIPAAGFAGAADRGRVGEGFWRREHRDPAGNRVPPDLAPGGAGPALGGGAVEIWGDGGRDVRDRDGAHGPGVVFRVANGFDGGIPCGDECGSVDAGGLEDAKNILQSMNFDGRFRIHIS